VIYKFGDVVHLKGYGLPNGLRAEVLNDEGGDCVLVALEINRYHFVKRQDIILEEDNELDISTDK
jgi:hypothetical protein